MELYFRALGQGQPLIFLHGIFGSADNWLSHTRALSDHHKTLALDLRNHGHSPHAEDFDYPSMTADVLGFVEKQQLVDPVVIGHSMGGKVAMNFAVAHPEKLQKLVVVDMAPKPYNMKNYNVLEGLKAVPIETVTSRNEADEAMAAFVPEPEIRQFLLKNLQRKPEGGFAWKLNLSSIARNIEKIGFDLQFPGKFEKPTLFIRGARSNYVKDKDVNRIHEIFPAAKIAVLDTGHWVPAEKPKEFVQLVRDFIAAPVE